VSRAPRGRSHGPWTPRIAAAPRAKQYSRMGGRERGRRRKGRCGTRLGSGRGRADELLGCRGHRRLHVSRRARGLRTLVDPNGQGTAGRWSGLLDRHRRAWRVSRKLPVRDCQRVPHPRGGNSRDCRSRPRSAGRPASGNRCASPTRLTFGDRDRTAAARATSHCARWRVGRERGLQGCDVVERHPARSAPPFLIPAGWTPGASQGLVSSVSRARV